VVTYTSRHIYLFSREAIQIDPSQNLEDRIACLGTSLGSLSFMSQRRCRRLLLMTGQVVCAFYRPFHFLLVTISGLGFLFPYIYHVLIFM